VSGAPPDTRPPAYGHAGAPTDRRPRPSALHSPAYPSRCIPVHSPHSRPRLARSRPSRPPLPPASSSHAGRLRPSPCLQTPPPPSPRPSASPPPTLAAAPALDREIGSRPRRAPLPSRAQARARAAHSAASRAPRSTPPHSAHSRAPDAPLLVAARPRDAQIPSASTSFTAPSTPPTLFGSPPRRLVRTLPDAEAYPRVSPVSSRTRRAPRRGPGEPELAGARARRRAHARGGRRKNGRGVFASYPPEYGLFTF